MRRTEWNGSEQGIQRTSGATNNNQMSREFQRSIILCTSLYRTVIDYKNSFITFYYFDARVCVCVVWARERIRIASSSLCVQVHRVRFSFHFLFKAIEEEKNPEKQSWKSNKSWRRSTPINYFKLQSRRIFCLAKFSNSLSVFLVWSGNKKTGKDEIYSAFFTTSRSFSLSVSHLPFLCASFCKFSFDTKCYILFSPLK